jgi:uncharacterized protein
VITVFLVEAWADQVTRRELNLPDGATIADALMIADIAAEDGNIGLWGKFAPLDTALNDGDRLERYRGLIADPKQARHQRANDQGYRWQGRTRRAVHKR